MCALLLVLRIAAVAVMRIDAHSNAGTTAMIWPSSSASGLCGGGFTPPGRRLDRGKTRLSS